MSDEIAPRRPFSNEFIAIFPALFAWQLYGWLIAIAVFVFVLITLAAISWSVVLDKMSARKGTAFRVTFIFLIFAGLAVSAAQICDFSANTCRNLF